jgi:hypothetical protein
MLEGLVLDMVIIDHENYSIQFKSKDKHFKLCFAIPDYLKVSFFKMEIVGSFASIIGQKLDGLFLEETFADDTHCCWKYSLLAENGFVDIFFTQFLQAPTFVEM